MVQLKKTIKPISAKQIEQKWHVVDLQGQVLGRASNMIANLLQGKHKATYVPHIDSGDYVVVINAMKVVTTGSKASNKEYSYYSGYPGGQRNVSFKQMLEKRPDEIIRHAVSGMLPKNKLRDPRLARLFVFPDDKHPYQDKVAKS